MPVKATYRKEALAATRVHLDVEMETGTGKTYCYIKTIFELNKRYGWSKFIIMVPSIAIREGVQKSLQITADHFTEGYGKKARFFVYNSKRLHELESFSSDAGINVMVMNIQAFNARGADNRRIYDELDDFQSRRPIDVIAANRPILILDEPQKMEGAATMEALPKFKPLMILRYSATHRTLHNRIHRLDALDAYNQKLVKKIAVRGIQTRGLAGTNAYLYLEGIELSSKAPVARIELEVKLKSGEIKRQLRRLKFRDDLFAESGSWISTAMASSSARSTPTTTPSSSSTAWCSRRARPTVTCPRAISAASRFAKPSRRISTARSSSSLRGSRCCRCSSSMRWRSIAITARRMKR